MGFLGLEWCDFPFRCLPIYRHLKEKTKRNNRSLRVARKPAQNMTGKLAPKGKKNEKRGGFSPCGRQSHMGMDPNIHDVCKAKAIKKKENTNNIRYFSFFNERKLRTRNPTNYIKL